MLFTERNGMRSPIKSTENINSEMYGLLLDCCEKYQENLAYKFPEFCPDGSGICGMDIEKFICNLIYDIPTLYGLNIGEICKPQKNYFSNNEKLDYDQFALLDYIEYFAKNIQDIVNRKWHDFFKHNELQFKEDFDSNPKIFEEFQNEINKIFTKTGLLYTLTNNKIIERTIDNEVLTNGIVKQVENIEEDGLKSLLQEAIKLHRSPKPEQNYTAVEKIWDALERLKTYNTNVNKKRSLEIILNNVAHGDKVFIDLFDDEFQALTKIGNNFRIRHHETNKINITDNRYFDYFFNRCMSLIALVIQYL